MRCKFNITISVNVVAAPSSITVSGEATIEPSQKTTFTATPKMADGSNLIYNSNQVKWSVDGDIGTINSTGVFTSNGKLGKATITATIGTKSVTKQIEVKEAFSGDVYTISGFEALSNVSTSTALAKASIALENSKTIGKEGKSSLKLDYDMTGNASGTAAAYVNFKPALSMPSKPKKLGVWMYGNSGQTWVRGVVRDADGNKETIDFTANGGQTWTGWKYIETAVPQTLSFPITVESLYVVQPTVARQNKGTVYFDKLQAVYTTNYVESLFNDVDNKHGYKTEIQYLVNKGLISGYGDGTFKPKANLTRAHAAILIARALKLDLSNIADPGFTDVTTKHPYYREIAAITSAGIMSGYDGKFNPSGELTRVQMAKILVKAYNLQGASTKTFSDLPAAHWGASYVNTLAVNGVTSGYPDGTFGTNGKVTRQHFSAFLYRILIKK